jgi:hypothetical protein
VVDKMRMRDVANPNWPISELFGSCRGQNLGRSRVSRLPNFSNGATYCKAIPGPKRITAAKPMPSW